jgi:hypothetical protein
MENFKKYVGFFFDASRWEVIPKRWIFSTSDGHMKCFWQPENVHQLAKQCAPVDESR